MEKLEKGVLFGIGGFRHAEGKKASRKMSKTKASRGASFEDIREGPR